MSMPQTIKSPFPGVDPYLESQEAWRDFHSEFIHCWRETLLKKLPAEYSARVNEDVYIGKLSGAKTRRFVVPDVALVRSRKRARRADAGGVAVLADEEVSLQPDLIPHFLIEERQIRYIEIYKNSTDELVAVLELLSPTNKHWGRKTYWGKRQALRRAHVHLVEVDLLIEGSPPPLALQLPEAHFHVLLTRSESPGECAVYSWNLPDRLPTIPIPLAAPDADLTSNLSIVFNMAYERGQYPRVIDYAQPLELPLDAKTRKWAASLARKFVSGK
jgi:hypothetical protein